MMEDRLDDAGLRVRLFFQPLLQLLHGLTTMRDLVFLDLLHLSVCLALVFERRVPS